MKPAAFEYVRPTTLAEALAALDHDDAKLLAGGQSLVPMMNFRLVQPERIVDINHVAELRGIVEDGDAVRIGALTRHAEAARDPLLARMLPVVAEAMANVAHVAIRNRGTIGGSLCHADPSAEWPLLTVLLDASIDIASAAGRRSEPGDGFFIAPLVTALEDGEIVVAVRVPRPAPGTGMAFLEVAQRAGDFAAAAAGATVRLDGDRIVEARLALGGVADAPMRLAAIEAALAGADRRDIADAVADAAADLEPNDDMHASADYRRRLIPVLARRALERAAERSSTLAMVK
ncbi:FAD binding domain-containing protein [Acuticoccus mangrovi]|uniref:Xanthine dehydrogenase family protein subunit M n=1 Tax=Acuticoccus mangrovi TaxID=2796142 RepID=A0A934ISV4_9HYPH|nr:xanthine dehydrogenase family protein subunit M [Acuticoccus mangrovi]MBJ3777054.1 xanthine dehydrogenase family protein subunit M [Acuticoccus mangrovi]